MHAFIASFNLVAESGENVATSVLAWAKYTACEIEPDDPWNMRFLLALEFTQAAPQSCWLNEAASRNIRFISVTRDTSHLDISTLNFENANILFMSTAFDTSHAEMFP